MTRPAGAAGGPIVIAISGPDGAGKSTVAHELAARLEADGHRVVSVYTYGCAVCRRVPPSLQLTIASGREADGAGHVPRLLAVLNTAHALVDATELRLRLWLARRTARRGWQAVMRSGGARHDTPLQGACAKGVVVAERSALDGLVKYAGSAPRLATRAFRAVEHSYDLVVWLDATPSVLFERDREHDEAFFAAMTTEFRRVAVTVPGVVRLEAAAPVPATVSAILARVTAMPERGAQ